MLLRKYWVSSAGRPAEERDERILVLRRQRPQHDAQPIRQRDQVPVEHQLFDPAVGFVVSMQSSFVTAG